jgi:histidine ammonia-lyase
MGEGRVHDANGVEMPTMQALEAAGIKPIELEAKEGLALINGTDGMLGMLIMACADLEHLCAVADITTAMSIEGLLGTDRVFAPDLHAPLRPQIGQAVSAANIYALLKGSGIVASHLENDSRVQDAYSLRCAPQVNGAITKIPVIADTQIFHAGTTQSGDALVSAGGRVMTITGLGEDLTQARDRAYRAISQIELSGSFYRSDIALNASVAEKGN